MTDNRVDRLQAEVARKISELRTEILLLWTSLGSAEEAARAVIRILGEEQAAEVAALVAGRSLRPETAE